MATKAKGGRGGDEHPSKRLGTLASKVLKDDRYSKTAKTLAGSVLTNMPNKPKGGGRRGR